MPSGASRRPLLLTRAHSTSTTGARPSPETTVVADISCSPAKRWSGGPDEQVGDFLLALAEAAEALARLARAVAEEDVNDPDALIPIKGAAVIAATSARVVTDAVRLGDLPAFGGQRDRAVRRSDLARWIESRRVRVAVGPDDRDIERRMAILEQAPTQRRGHR